MSRLENLMLSIIFMSRTAFFDDIKPQVFTVTFAISYRPLLATAILSASLVLTAGAGAQEITVTHVQGETKLDGVPEKVFVIDWAAYDNLSALGVNVAGAPGSNAPSYLADFVGDDLVNTGSLFEPDIEGIAAEQPDLIIVAGRSATSYDILSSLAPTIDMSVDNSSFVEGVRHNIETLGEIFDRQGDAAALIAELDAKTDAARAAVQGNGTGLVIVTNGNRIGVYGPDSRVAWIYNDLGFPSVFDEVDDSDHGGDSISFEYLLETNPDWLFVVDRDAGVGNEGSARGLLDNELVHQTTFWQNDQMVFLDAQAAYISMHGYNGLHLLLDQVLEGLNGAQ